MNKKYILITAAKNEQDYIGETIKSVVAQTIKPFMWFIVSDGSTDKTDEIIKTYAQSNDFIQFIRNDNTDDRNFASKVYAINIALKKIKDNNIEYDFIGILDADAKFENNYYESILAEFEKDPKLGLAGGIFFEYYKGKKIKVVLASNSVRGAVQFFRKECFNDIGGFTPLNKGGEDIITEVTARMKGWTVQTFDHLSVVNLRLSGLGRWGIVETKFREGMLAKTIGYHPLFQIVKSFYRFKERPYFISGILHLFGYLWALISGQEVKVTKEFMTYLRKEQMQRLKETFTF
ncbi:MAG: glycosyltransferase family 2 protein [Ignavibacteriales bacterium]|nr:glycosyltransferase family 2 protein [Ignavibacteriales bacterium]